MTTPLLPPAYDLVVDGPDADVLERALRAARTGEAGDGTLFWSGRQDRLEAALVLEPEQDAARTALVQPVMGVAVADALGALLPPLIPVDLGLPSRIGLDGAVVGELRLRLPSGAGEERPAWCILSLSIALARPPGEAGEAPWRTSLADCGGGGITAAALLESICRHFLTWMHLWEEEGFAPVALSWNARCQQGPERHWRLAPDGALQEGEALRSLPAVLTGTDA